MRPQSAFLLLVVVGGAGPLQFDPSVVWVRRFLEYEKRRYSRVRVWKPPSGADCEANENSERGRGRRVKPTELKSRGKAHEANEGAYRCYPTHYESRRNCELSPFEKMW